MLENFFIKYVCGYLLNRTLQVHSCEICTKYSKDHTELDDSSVYCFLKAYENANKDLFGNLKMPNDEFVELICKLEFIFQQNFETNVCANFLQLANELELIIHVNIFQKNMF